MVLYRISYFFFLIVFSESLSILLTLFAWNVSKGVFCHLTSLNGHLTRNNRPLSGRKNNLQYYDTRNFCFMRLISRFFFSLSFPWNDTVIALIITWNSKFFTALIWLVSTYWRILRVITQKRRNKKHFFLSQILNLYIHLLHSWHNLSYRLNFSNPRVLTILAHFIHISKCYRSFFFFPLLSANNGD